MRKHVYIDPKCLATSLIPTALEEYHKEVSGYLIGSNGTGRFKVVSAYPIQSDIKMPTWVETGNESAVRRVNKLMKTMRMRLVGGFHSHPLGPPRPSRNDIDFIRERLDEHSLQQWLEIIVSVRKKDYLTRHSTGWQLHQYENKLGMTIKTSPWTGFGVTLSGFWIPSSGRIREATLWTSRRCNF
ncbi:MAG: Mov34/MPN/PAD-1 family protein [Candidatus Aenigmarchaeota archaeon]|nr:Mov34/MPN/PAD-1 family protein [Candidatus Aenigmarchaeota archaeon]